MKAYKKTFYILGEFIVVDSTTASNIQSFQTNSESNYNQKSKMTVSVFQIFQTTPGWPKIDSMFL